MHTFLVVLAAVVAGFVVGTLYGQKGKSLAIAEEQKVAAAVRGELYQLKSKVADAGISLERLLAGKVKVQPKKA